MDTEIYLIDQLSQNQPTVKKNKYWHAYTRKRVQRFFLCSIMAFFLQYLNINHLAFTYPTLPMYPPMGSAFVMLYLLGNSTLLGLFLGGFCAYLLNGLSLSTLLLYIMADLGASYLGAKVCRSVFSSDWSLYTDSKEWLRFIKKNAFITCVISSVPRTITIFLNHTSPMTFKIVFYNFINFYLADLNAIIVFSGFFLPWMSVHLGREIFTCHKHCKVQMLSLILFGITCVTFLKHPEFIVIAIPLSWYLSHQYGAVIATTSSYILTILFLIVFIFHQQQVMNYLGIQIYTLIPVALLLFLLITLYLGHRTSRKHDAQSNDRGKREISQL